MRSAGQEGIKELGALTKAYIVGRHPITTREHFNGTGERGRIESSAERVDAYAVPVFAQPSTDFVGKARSEEEQRFRVA